MSVKMRLIAMAGVALLSLIILNAIAVFGLSRLADLQDEGFELSLHQAAATEASSLGIQFYQIIADAVINRDLDKARKDFAALRAEADKDLAYLAKAADTDAEKQAVSEARKAIDSLVALFEKQMLPILGNQNQVAQDIRELDGKIDNQVTVIRENLQQVAASMADEAEKGDALFDETRRFTTWQMLALALAGAVAVAVIAWRIIASNMAPLGTLQDISSRIAAGDLSGHVRTEAPLELANVLVSCAKMRESLHSTVSQLQTSANDIHSMSTQMAATTEQLAQASEQQAQAASSMAASVEEMSVSITQVSDNSDEVKKAAERSNTIATEGRSVIQVLVNADTTASASVGTAAGQIRQLSDLSGQISSIVAVIRDIADQTNLLALNAAIEAARAGEQGRGFAVVADEVRKLAERTTQSTQEIGNMIHQVQTVTGGAVESMEKVVAEMGNLRELSEKADHSMDQINVQSGSVMAVVGNISVALQEQSAASEDIARRVETIAQMSEENSAAIQQTATAAQQLSAVAVSLQENARKFKLAA